MCVYSDGSGIDGSAGAAAVLFWDGLEVRAIRYQLGPLTQHTTYKAEVIGVLLALELLRRERRVHMASIKLDNQAVIQALGVCSTKPAQSLLNMVHGACEEWMAGDRQGHRQLGISWISGHDGVKGNERADKEARKAVSDGSSPCEDLPDVLQEGPLPYSLTVLGGSFQADLRERWKSLWAKSPQRGRMDKINANSLCLPS